MDRVIGGMPRAIVIAVLVVAAGIGAWLSDAGAAVTRPDATNNGTLPLGTGFVADDANHRPLPPNCVKVTDPGWNIPFARAALSATNACNNTPTQYRAGSSPLLCK